MYLVKTARFVVMVLAIALTVQTQAGELCRLKSPDGLNVISVSLNEDGQPSYRLERKGQMLIDNSPLGLRCKDTDFSRGMTLEKVGPEEVCRQQYQLCVGNHLSIDSTLAKKSLTLKNPEGAFVMFELAASNDGIGFRYRIEGDNDSLYTVIEELTGFQVPESASAWMQPYHAAGPYTPAYEDFYFHVASGDMPPVSREKPRGWCLPGLFEMTSANGWMLIAESDVNGSYCAGHLEPDSSSKGLYRIAFAYEDEVTGAKKFDPHASKTSVLTRGTPWRVVLMADQPAGILDSTLITDLATPCQIQDTSWIRPGRASWAWWSHPEGPADRDLFNSFTDLATDFNWEYTLFDAGWWNPGLREISEYANQKGIKPLAWMHASDFYDAKRRVTKLDEAVSNGIKGIKVDFWCSDRQAAMQAMHDTLRDAAERKLVVNFHGCTIPRGWHRTWPNLLTAEAVLGTESYFYEPRYPDKTAQQNTILPFTRNVMGPMDITPVALMIRKFPRKTTAAHELAAAIVFNSGIIHFADSVEMFHSFPDEVKRVLTDAPTAWDQTECLIGDPGQKVVLARRTGQQWFIAGLNGTDAPMPISLDLRPFGVLDGAFQITEGGEPLMHFSVREISDRSVWQNQMPPFGGFVLCLGPEKANRTPQDK